MCLYLSCALTFSMVVEDKCVLYNLISASHHSILCVPFPLPPFFHNSLVHPAETAHNPK